MALQQASKVARITAAPRVAPRVQRVRVSTRAVAEVTDNSFAEDVLKSSTPVLVDFWAPCE
jgi:thioredoxin-like negative regulator of GroEL